MPEKRRRLGLKALVFRHSLAREAAATIGGRLDQRAFVSRLAPVRLEDVDDLTADLERGFAALAAAR